MSSDNPMAGGAQGATPENQQERLEDIGWVVGFVDGEGCFSAPVVKSPKMTLGWQVQPAFAVVQGASSRQVLDNLVDFFNCGAVYLNRRHDNHKEDLLRYTVNARRDLVGRIIPFFRQHQLRTTKRSNFEKFATIIEMMEEGRQLTLDGLAEIASISQTMNHRKPSPFLRILRDHTPAIS
jgi:LAGLIDADG endonuclease